MAWLGQHPVVHFEDLTQSSERAYRFRHAGLVLTAYRTGKVLLQGRGVGSVSFKGLHCKSCSRKPLVIQGLEYMMKVAENQSQLQRPNQQQRGVAAQQAPVRLEDQVRRINYEAPRIHDGRG